MMCMWLSISPGMTRRPFRSTRSRARAGERHDLPLACRPRRSGRPRIATASRLRVLPVERGDPAVEQDEVGVVSWTAPPRVRAQPEPGGEAAEPATTVRRSAIVDHG